METRWPDRSLAISRQQKHPDSPTNPGGLDVCADDWRAKALAVRIESDTSEMSAEELQRLRSLGYLN